jgi:hypothetical protein
MTSKMVICSAAKNCVNTECYHSYPHEHTDACKIRVCHSVYVTCHPELKKQFLKGDRVIFIENKTNYTIEERNPLFGTKFFCAGTVISVSSERIDVAWDNGHKNIYEPDDLIDEYIIRAGNKLMPVNPNLTFKNYKLYRKN